MNRKKVLILGAAGRDFHNFNCVYRDNPAYEVVAFTATQIPNIANRRYPASLAGRLYPDGIPILDEADLDQILRDFGVDEVVFSYSDVAHEHVMDRASHALAAGADFRLLGPKSTALRSRIPVIAVCAVRTGCGKSQTSRYVVRFLRENGLRVAVVRHPMPYGDLEKQVVQRFACRSDLDKAQCTIEEREEYEPHLEQGAIVFAGVDYQRILAAAEAEADVILWDGGNNDLPFFWPDLHITLVDPLRPGHERTYHPGQANLLAADVIVINKVDSADEASLKAVRQSIKEMNPKALVVEARSEIQMYPETDLRNKKVVVVEDGPTLTHGEMGFGAGTVLARKNGAIILDPRPYAKGSIREIFEKYQHLGPVLPAMGYSQEQINELRETLEASEAELVVTGTPIDLAALLKLTRPVVRARYELVPVARGSLDDALRKVLEIRRAQRG